MTVPIQLRTTPSPPSTTAKSAPPPSDPPPVLGAGSTYLSRAAGDWPPPRSVAHPTDAPVDRTLREAHPRSAASSPPEVLLPRSCATEIRQRFQKSRTAGSPSPRP